MKYQPVIFFALFMFWGGCSSSKTEEPAIKNYSKVVYSEVMIFHSGIRMPLNRIFVAHKGETFCAFRFTDFWEGEGKEEHYAKYDVWPLEKKKTGSSATPPHTIKGRLVATPIIGWPHTGCGGRPGSVLVMECADISLGWASANVAYFTPNNGPDNQDVEMAPTKWTEISEVNVADPRLKWYRYEDSRKEIVMDVEQLW